MNNRLIIADAHVHLYDCLDMAHLLDLIFSNFQKEANKPIKGTSFSAFLFLAETKTENWFYRFSSQPEKGPSQAGEFGRWTFRPTRERCSLYARSDEKKGFYVIAGRQIRTRENLEVLALGTQQSFEEGAPLKEIITLISRLGAIPVIPWGVGKWIGRRGEFLKNLLGRDLPPFFLGDNRNRPLFWPRPNFFKQAEQRGLAVLSGSDPLPFPSEMRKIGRFGIKLPGSIDPEYPFRELKKLLQDPMARPQTYGSLENPVRFFFNQLRMKRKLMTCTKSQRR
jgi:hypothetical protein